jgi:hypothetical protein
MAHPNMFESGHYALVLQHMMEYEVVIDFLDTKGYDILLGYSTLDIVVGEEVELIFRYDGVSYLMSMFILGTETDRFEPIGCTAGSWAVMKLDFSRLLASRRVGRRLQLAISGSTGTISLSRRFPYIYESVYTRIISIFGLMRFYEWYELQSATRSGKMRSGHTSTMHPMAAADTVNCWATRISSLQTAG